MPKDSRYVQIAFSIQKMLENNGKLDHKELDELIELALKDEEIDEDERRILHLIFRQLEPKDVASDAWDKLQEVRKRYRL